MRFPSESDTVIVCVCVYVQVVVCVAEPELERWASTLQRWEMKKEQDRTANGCKAAARTRSLT